MGCVKRHITLFIASPSELAQERQTVSAVIAELNDTFDDGSGITIDVVKWETHTYSSAGADVQDTINTQIREDYEIFVGLLWTRIGTATPRAESGTVEEFNRAMKRYKKDPTAVHVMFFFKEAPTIPSVIDPQQLQAVQNFRKRLEEDGFYYTTFDSTTEFRDKFRAQVFRLRKHIASRPGGSIPDFENDRREVLFRMKDLGVTLADAQPIVLTLVEIIQSVDSPDFLRRYELFTNGPETMLKDIIAELQDCSDNLEDSFFRFLRAEHGSDHLAEKRDFVRLMRNILRRFVRPYEGLRAEAQKLFDMLSAAHPTTKPLSYGEANAAIEILPPKDKAILDLLVSFVLPFAQDIPDVMRAVLRLRHVMASWLREH